MDIKVRYKGMRPADVVSAPTGRQFPVEPGQELEVDEETAKSLLEQTDKWAKVSSKPKDSKTKESD